MTDPPRGPLRPAGDAVWRQPGRMSCPACGHNPDALGSLQGPHARAPRTGDYSVCIKCGEVTVIEVHPLLGATLREASLTELAEFSRNREAAETVRAVHRSNRGRKHR